MKGNKKTPNRIIHDKTQLKHALFYFGFYYQKSFAFYLFSYQRRSHEHMMSKDYDSDPDQFYLNYSLFQMSTTYCYPH